MTFVHAWLGSATRITLTTVSYEEVDMELSEAMRSTGTCRYYTDEQVPDDVLYRAFDDARFGPQGGLLVKARMLSKRYFGRS